jgi:hypothetical protein
VQGLTIKEIIIDPTKFTQSGQGYGSVTRPDSLNGVFFPYIKEETFFCDERIEESVAKMKYQYAGLKENCSFRILHHSL